VKVEIISIGDELLIGQIVNTNASWLGQFLNNYGLTTNKCITIGDNLLQIIDSFEEAEKDCDIVIITGGLGPTKDDLTKEALCKYFDTKLIFNEKVFEQVKTFLENRSGTMNELNSSQAMIPENSIPLTNIYGTAPGLWIEKHNKIFIALPGVPYEMKTLMENEVIPRLIKRFSLGEIFHKNILTIGIAEALLAEKLKEFENSLEPEIKLAYLPSPGIVKLRLSTYNSLNKELIENKVKQIFDIIPEYIVSTENENINEVIGKLLIKNQKTISTAESCTGGSISKMITAVPGSSEYYNGSIIAYSNKVKEEILRVPNEIISKYGAVSQQVVELMALNANKIFNTDYSLATSGIAGPTGGTKDKPIGTVWIAVAENDKVISKKYLFGDIRERNIEKASIYALNMLRLKILNFSII
jgi:nicotinamide-nucleotide amidase